MTTITEGFIPPWVSYHQPAPSTFYNNNSVIFKGFLNRLRTEGKYVVAINMQDIESRNLTK